MSLLAGVFFFILRTRETYLTGYSLHYFLSNVCMCSMCLFSFASASVISKHKCKAKHNCVEAGML